MSVSNIGKMPEKEKHKHLANHLVYRLRHAIRLFKRESEVTILNLLQYKTNNNGAKKADLYADSKNPQ